MVGHKTRRHHGVRIPRNGAIKGASGQRWPLVFVTESVCYRRGILLFGYVPESETRSLGLCNENGQTMGLAIDAMRRRKRRMSRQFTRKRHTPCLVCVRNIAILIANTRSCTDFQGSQHSPAPSTRCIAKHDWAGATGSHTYIIIPRRPLLSRPLWRRYGPRHIPGVSPPGRSENAPPLQRPHISLVMPGCGGG